MLGQRLRDLRKRKGYSQVQMARKLHITQGAISQWENDLTTPAADQLVMIAKVFDISVDELLGREHAELIEKKYGDQPKTPEAKILAYNIDHLPEEDRKRAIAMFDLMFDLNADRFERKVTDDTKL